MTLNSSLIISGHPNKDFHVVKKPLSFFFLTIKYCVWYAFDPSSLPVIELNQHSLNKETPLGKYIPQKNKPSTKDCKRYDPYFCAFINQTLRLAHH